VSSLPDKIQPGLLQAFQSAEALERVGNTKIGCILVITLMPAGTLADYFVYHHWQGRDWLWPFFFLRLLCSALAAAIWGLLLTDRGRKLGKPLGVIVPLLPVVFLAGMIAATEGFASPYYAALNLVLLAVGAVLHWTPKESLIAVGLVIPIYIGAGCFHGSLPSMRILFSNFYFIALMDVIVVVGTYFQSRARFREFALRFELDLNRKALETSLQQLKENELQLVQSEKLASLGRMSAGIIHEINTPLNFATTGLFTLRKKARHLVPDQQADYTEVLTDVEDGLKRVQAIVSDLRTFTHPDVEQLDVVRISEVLTPALRFLSDEWREKIHIEQQLPEDLAIRGNKNKLIQVMVNLLQNSLDALKEKTFPASESPAIWITGQRDKARIKLVVRDNGSGIDAEHQGKIFDPFFTTKAVGAGMGLGLSVCYRIVQEYKGTITLRSQRGQFCEFTLDFPFEG